MQHSSIGTRMRNYEDAQKTSLLRRVPVVIRIDGKSFHSFTRGMERPFDDGLMRCMNDTTRQLVKNIEGCEFGYTQSDEISLLLTDYKSIRTMPWFDYKMHKLISVAAGMASNYFTRSYYENFLYIDSCTGVEPGELPEVCFDARAFNIPKDEVVNYYIYRQQDATRNSVQMLGRAHFSQKMMHNKSNDEVQEMLFQEKGINWNDLPVSQKRGTCVVKETIELDRVGVRRKAAFLKEIHGEDFDISKIDLTKPIIRTNYKIDENIPIFAQARDYVQKFVDVEED